MANVFDRVVVTIGRIRFTSRVVTEMASFVPYHRKKIEQLEKKETALIRLIERGASAEKLLAVALKVRDCRISVVRARQNEMHPTNRVGYLRAEDKIKVLQTIRAQDVLDEFLRAAQANDPPSD